jgi:8-hydroxy-5-deazaflavin:NADPH oxidoreductase
MKIAVLGTGRVGTALADALVGAGHDVTVGSRQPEDHSDSSAVVTSLARAIEEGDVVITAIPGGAAIDTLVSFATELSGKILLDVSNAVNREGLIYPNSSLGEHLQRTLPDTLVVKSLNTVNTSVMVSPDALEWPTTVFLSGDDADAKSTISTILASLGWGADSQLDLGGIETARGPEHYFLLFLAALGALGTPTFNVAVVK